MVSTTIFNPFLSTKRSAVTKEDPALLRESRSEERRKFLLKNHTRAVRMLKKLRPHQHRQYSWAEKEGRNECGTAACGLGWVALTNILPGLQWRATRNKISWETDQEGNDVYNEDIDVMINGRKSEWDIAGTKFFGHTTMRCIFEDGSLSLPGLISKMEKRISALKKPLYHPE